MFHGGDGISISISGTWGNGSGHQVSRFGINTDTGKESERWKVGLIGDRDEAVHGMGPSTKFPISVCLLTK